MTESRKYVDPFRRIISVRVGSGCDTLTLECGHAITKGHKAHWGSSTSCHQCREWF